MLQSIKKYKTPISHLLIWLTIFILLLLILPNRFGQSNVSRSLFMTIAYGSLILVNTQWMMPKLFYKKKYSTYFLFCVLIFVLVYGYFFLVYSYAVHIEFPEKFHEQMKLKRDFKPNNHFPIFGDMIIGVLIFITSIAFKSSQLAVLKEKETIQLKNENLNTELKFLRSQINPHFLFNSLHNIYTLSVIKSDKTSQMIIMLSDMLRFMLYDCKKEKVMISREVDYLKNFIALARLKDEHIKNIATEFDIQKEDLLIEPMLFIPFLENSFKHSKIEDLENGWINLKMKAEMNKVTFELENSIAKNKFTKDQVGGIGLENVKRRLSLLYPDNHELSITQSTDTFSVKLNLLV
ncbi:sensor histidine kinase [Reichenbachiella sp. MALMAid0571]|uniref:sensor histidine kinase n=1 Tax=Reichenbachiella sp. MALMAid0571 TaxID=3143939 RepID=UPI0032DFA3FA